VNHRALLTIAALRLRLLRRDRQAAFFMLVLPVILIFVIGVAIGGINNHVTIGIVVEDHGPRATDLQHELAAAPALRLQTYRDRAELTRAVRTTAVAAGVVVPAGYDRDLDAGRPVAVPLVSDPSKSATGAVRSAVSSVVARENTIAMAARASAASGGSAASALAAARTIAGQTAGGLRVTRVSVRGRATKLPSGFNWTAPTELVLFVFISSLVAGGRVVQLRTAGLASRALAAPIGASTFLLGELLGSYLVALAQGLIIVVLGATVFHVDWGAFPATLAVVAAAALVATALGVTLGSLLRTEEQAAALGPPLGIGLAMLGGCMWPLAIVGRTMRAIGHLTPQSWAVDAFIKLVGNGATLRAIAPQLAVLIAYAAVLVPIAVWRFRRTVMVA